MVVLLHAGLLRVGLRDMPDEHGADAVRPLARLQVEGAVQLVHRDALRVHLVDAHELELGVVLDAAHRGLQRAHHPALAAPRRPDEHHAVAHHRHLVQLDALERERLGLLQPALGDDVGQVRLELRVLRDGLLDARQE